MAAGSRPSASCACERIDGICRGDVVAVEPAIHSGTPPPASAGAIASEYPHGRAVESAASPAPKPNPKIALPGDATWRKGMTDAQKLTQ